MIADIFVKPVSRRRSMCATAMRHEIATNLTSQIVGVDIVGGQPEYVRACLNHLANGSSEY